MGTMGTINDSQMYSRKLFTILALAALLGAQLITMGVGAASANGGWTAHRVILEFDDGTVYDSQGSGEFDGEDHLHGSGADLALWETDEANIHLSCSENLVGREVVHPDGHTLSITNFFLDTSNPGEGTEGRRSCGPEGLQPTVTASCTGTASEPSLEYTVEFGGALAAELTVDGEQSTVTPDGATDSTTATIDWPRDSGNELKDSVDLEVSFRDFNGSTHTDEATALLADCPADPDPVSGISLEKVADQTALVDPEVGDEVNYTFTITNTGEDALSGTELTDAIYDGLAELGDYDESGFDLDVLTGFTIDDADGATLDVDEELVLTDAYTHTITQDDIDRGGIYNVATVTATGDESGDEVDATDDELVTITTSDPDPVSGISLEKVADQTALVDPEVGDEVNYTFTITNTGEDALSGTELTDAIYDGLAELGDYDESGFDLDVLTGFTIDDADGATLDVDEQLVLTDAYTHTITQDDIDRGGIYNVATVTATGDESGDEVSATDDELVTITTTPPVPPEPEPGISLEKSAVDGVQFDETDNAFVQLGEGESVDITYEYEITNTGDEVLVELDLDDDRIGDLTEQFLAEIDDDGFAPGDVVTVTATHEGVTLDDFEDDQLINVALVDGEGEESGTEVSDQDTEVVTGVEVLAQPEISVEKTAIDGVETDDEGNWVVDLAEGETATIVYEFVVSNPQSETLTDLSLIDDKIGDLSTELQDAATAEFGEAIVPGGESVTITADYETTAEDFEDGFVTNVVDVEGEGVDSGITVTDRADETVLITEVLADVDEVDEDEPDEPTDEPDEPQDEPDEPEDDAEEEVEVAGETLPKTGIDSDSMLLLALLFGLLSATAFLLAPKSRGPGSALA